MEEDTKLKQLQDTVRKIHHEIHEYRQNILSGIVGGASKGAKIKLPDALKASIRTAQTTLVGA